MNKAKCQVSKSTNTNFSLFRMLYYLAKFIGIPELISNTQFIDSTFKYPWTKPNT